MTQCSCFVEQSGNYFHACNLFGMHKSVGVRVELAKRMPSRNNLDATCDPAPCSGLIELFIFLISLFLQLITFAVNGADFCNAHTLLHKIHYTYKMSQLGYVA